MADVKVTMDALVAQLKDSMKMETYLVDAMPATFDLNTIYVIFPEEVDVTHYIGSGSFQTFDVEILVPVKQIDSGHQEILERSIMESVENINHMMADTFRRFKIIGTGHIHNTRFQVSQWEVNGYVYAAADVTVSVKSFLDV